MASTSKARILRYHAHDPEWQVSDFSADYGRSEDCSRCVLQAGIVPESAWEKSGVRERGSRLISTKPVHETKPGRNWVSRNHRFGITSGLPTYRYRSDVTECIGDHALADMSDRAEAD
jgi:hypothetical protein